MNILVLNCGSSSLKYQLIDSKSEQVLAKGLCERIGIKGSRFIHENHTKTIIERDLKDHKEAIALVLDTLVDPDLGVIKTVDEIQAVGHRVVHGGEKFASSVIITDDVLNAIEECRDLAPLHNPPNLVGIYACKELLNNISQVAVFDTAFHQTMPEKAYLYALPYDYYDRYRIRRYGFHGTSHQYVSMRASKILNRDYKQMKIISCHLGNGASLCAILNGKSIDTSMGFTPLEGLAMGTRSGDMDPAILFYMMKKEKISIDDMDEILNKRSGVLGVSEVSSDFRDIEEAANKGNLQAKAALDLFHYRVAKYIGAYAAAMNGVHAIVFTAGLGENSSFSRAEICSYLSYLGVFIDPTKNKIRGEECDISASNASVRTLIIPTNEELMIARQTKQLLLDEK